MHGPINIKQISCCDFPYNFFYETFLVPGRNEKDMIKMCIVLPVNYPLLVSDVNKTRVFSTDLPDMAKCQIPR